MNCGTFADFHEEAVRLSRSEAPSRLTWKYRPADGAVTFKVTDNTVVTKFTTNSFEDMPRGGKAEAKDQGEAAGKEAQVEAPSDTPPSSGQSAAPSSLSSASLVPARTAFECACVSLCLGVCLAGAFILTFSKHFQFGLYITSIVAFHFLEFAAVALYRPREFGVRSFLLSHSWAFNVALLTGCLEYIVRPYAVAATLPSPLSGMLMRFLSSVSVVSAAAGIACSGLGLRFIAMRTAAESFAHVVQENPVPRQKLITHGPYAAMRHPSYAGFFLWAVGTQLVLGNVGCALLSVAACAHFFRDRVMEEEMFMLQPSFFGEEYAHYIASTPWTGVPFVEGICVSVKSR